MSISLNVVRSAAVFCASFSRSAMRRRSGLIGTASSIAPDSGRRERCSRTSSFRTRPPGPDAGTWPGSTPCCSISRSADGIRRGGAADGGGSGERAGTVGFGGGGGVAAFGAVAFGGGAG